VRRQFERGIRLPGIYFLFIRVSRNTHGIRSVHQLPGIPSSCDSIKSHFETVTSDNSLPSKAVKMKSPAVIVKG
jgi:hypothetical protein